MNQLKIIALTMGFLISNYITSSQAREPGDSTSAASSYLVYVGTYTGAKSKGIYLYRMDSATGAFTSLGLAAETPNPTFLDLSPNGRFLYAANEVNDFEGKAAGSVSAYSIEPDSGKLTFLNSRSSVGSGPCHVLVDHADKDVFVANYGSGSLAMLPILADGRLAEATAFFQFEGHGLNPDRQAKPHTHGTILDPANHFAYVCDLGIDKIMVYRFDSARGKLTPGTPPYVSVKPGSGPRHLTFPPDGRHAYLLNELSSTINTFAYNSRNGGLREIQTINMLPSDFKGKNTAAEIVVSPAGKFLYGSNRGDNSIIVYSIDPKSALLTFVQRQPALGKIPRCFCVDPTGKFIIVVNQDSNNLVVFTINQTTGELTPTGQSIEIPSPVCVKFLTARSK